MAGSLSLTMKNLRMQKIEPAHLEIDRREFESADEESENAIVHALAG